MYFCCQTIHQTQFKIRFMKKISSFFIVCTTMVLLSVACNAQQKQDSKVRNSQLSEQPAATDKATTAAANEAVKVQTNPRAGEFNQGYMVLPGFTPTGNQEVDNANYAAAKQEFVAKYPNDYIQRMEQLTNEGRQEWEKQQTNQQTREVPQAPATDKVIEIPRSRYNGMTADQKKRIDGNPQFKIVDDK